MRKLYKAFLCLSIILFAISSNAQVTLSGTSYTENFDNIGSGLPTGWTVRTGATASALGTAAALTTAATVWNNTAGAFKNFASADGLISSSNATAQNASTDRALGLRQTGAVGDPGGAFILQLANTTGLSAFTMSFKLQSLDAGSTRSTTWQVDYGIGASPSTFTMVGSTSITGNSLFSNNTINVSFGAALDNISQQVWIRIVTITASTGAGNRASSAIDDVQLDYTGGGAPTTTVSVTAGANAAEPATDGNFTVTLSTVSVTDITINYDFTGSSATLGSDFSDAGAGSVTILAGNLSAPIPIHTLDDALVEGTETIAINLTGATTPYTVSIGTASINLTSEDIATINFTGSYSQDFNTLAATGTSSVLPTGWLLRETGTNNNSIYTASDGTGGVFSGDTYSFGASGNPERAFGTTRSGSLSPTIGALFTNNTGATVTSLSINYTGEQWRFGAVARTDRLDFQYSLNANSLATGTWIDVDGLDFIAPSSTAVGGLNGNDPQNRIILHLIINGLSIPNGAVFAIRWNDFDATGADDGLGVDDFSITLGCTPPTNQPTTLNLTPALQSISGNFTAAVAGADPADAYLVLMSTSPTLTELPSSGTAYAGDDVIGNARVVSIAGTTFTATGLTPSTTYYFFVFSASSATNCYNINAPLSANISTNAPPACTPPVTQASNLGTASITGTTIDLTWTRGSGDNILVIAHAGAPVDATIYNSLGYFPGAEIGIGNFVIFNGSASSFSYGSLQQNTTYHFALYEYNSADSCYLSPALTGNFTTLCTNPVNVTALSGTAGNAQSNVSWTLPGVACFDEIIVVASTASVTGVGSDFTGSANPAYTSGEQIVYRGIGTNVLVTGLTNGVPYFFKVFTRKGVSYSNGVQISVIPFDPASGYLYLYGNLHAHSSYSDGNKDNLANTPNEDFAFARDALCMDFLGISEHNHSLAGMNYPDYATGFAEANSMNLVPSPGGNSIVTLWGMEWGVIDNGGHVLIYGFDDQLIGWEPGNYDIFVQNKDYASLWNVVNARSGAIATLAHPDNDHFSNLLTVPYNATADAAIAGVAIETGPAFSTSTTYNDFPTSPLKFLPYYRNLLSKGYHVAPQMDQDNHNLTFGTANSNRMVVLSSAKTREAVMEAIRSMRYYASQDCNMRIDFKNGSRPMGSLVTNNGAPSLSVSVTDPDLEGVATIEIWGGATGAAAPAAPVKKYIGASTINFGAADIANIQPNNSTWYYYAIVTQEDSNKAVTSAIWYTRNDFALPVTISSFRGEYDKTNKLVNLFWTTASESNSKEFIVERSGDGVHFTGIGKVNAAGNSNRIINYIFSDPQPLNGNNYYRLKQVDLDGKSMQSNTVRIQLGTNFHFSFSPNPARGNVSISIENSNGPVTILLTDLNGKLIRQKNISSAAAQTVPLYVNGLPGGIYLLKVISNKETLTEKIIIE